MSKRAGRQPNQQDSPTSQPQGEQDSPSEPGTTDSPLGAIVAEQMASQTDAERDAIDAVNDAAEQGEQGEQGEQDDDSEPSDDDSDQPSPSEPQGDQPSPSEPQGDAAATAADVWASKLDAATNALDAAFALALDAAPTFAVPSAATAHAGAILLTLGRGKRGDDARALLVAGIDQRAAILGRADRGRAMDYLDAAQSVGTAVAAWLDAHGTGATSEPAHVDPIALWTDRLVTLYGLTRIALGEQDSAIVAAVAAAVMAGDQPGTLDASVLRGIGGTSKRTAQPRTPRSPSEPGTRRAAGSIAAMTVTYLGEHAADGSAVKLGTIATAIGASAGAVRAAFDRGNVPTAEMVTDANGVRAARLLATVAQ